MEERKIRTTIYIDRKLMELARIEIENVSQVLETLLSNYLQTNSTEEIDHKIQEYKDKINVLKQKKDDLLRKGVYEDKMEGINDSFMQELRQIYKKRAEMGSWNEKDWYDWITTPKNLQRCKMLQMDPLEVLEDLKRWLDDQDEQPKKEKEKEKPVNQATVGL